MSGISFAVVGSHGSDLHDTIDALRELQRIQDDRYSGVRMAKEVDLIEFEISPDCLQVVDVVLNASAQFGIVRDEIRAATTPQIESDDQVIFAEVFEVVEQCEPVEDDERFRSAAQGLKKQPHSVVSRDVTVGDGHGILLQKHNSPLAATGGSGLSACFDLV